MFLAEILAEQSPSLRQPFKSGPESEAGECLICTLLPLISWTVLITNYNKKLHCAMTDWARVRHHLGCRKEVTQLSLGIPDAPRMSYSFSSFALAQFLDEKAIFQNTELKSQNNCSQLITIIVHSSKLHCFVYMSIIKTDQLILIDIVNLLTTLKPPLLSDQSHSRRSINS